jgi:hypothetical protein
VGRVGDCCAVRGGDVQRTCVGHWAVVGVSVPGRSRAAEALVTSSALWWALVGEHGRWRTVRGIRVLVALLVSGCVVSVPSVLLVHSFGR